MSKVGFRVLQSNCQKNRTTVETLLATEYRNYDVLLIQEPFRPGTRGDFLRMPSSDSIWDCYQPVAENVLGKEARVVTYVQKALGKRLNITPEPNFQTRDIMSVIIGGTRVVNVYHQPKRGQYKGALVELRDMWAGSPRRKAVVAGDFNLRHTAWEELSTPPTREACEAVKWFTDQGFGLVSPRNRPTRVAANSSTVIDVVMAKTDIADMISFGEHRESLSDHLQLDWRYNEGAMEAGVTEEVRRVDYDGMGPAEWGRFQEALTAAAKKMRRRKITTDQQIDTLAEEVTRVIQDTMNECGKIKRYTPRSKRWWTPYLKDLHKETVRAKKEAREEPSEETITRAKDMVNMFHQEVRWNKESTWNNFLENVQGGGIWRAAKYCKPAAQPNTLPALRKSDGTRATSLTGKANALEGGLFPPPPPSKSTPLDYTPVVNKEWAKLYEGELYVAINGMNSKKAPGPDTLKAKAIKQAYQNIAMRHHLHCLFDACIRRGYQPLAWRTSNTVVLQKGGKRDWAEPKSYRPISLLNVMGKVLESIMQRRLTHITRNKLPKEQFGGRNGYSAPDAVLKLIQDVQLNNRRKEAYRTTAMMVDIKGAFDKVHRDTLLSTLATLKVPETAIRWVCSFLTERTTSLIVDGKTLAPVSPLLFMLHTTPLYSTIKAAGGHVVGFIDDVTVYVHGEAGPNLRKLSWILTLIHCWADHHHMEIDYGDKLGIMHLGRRGPETKEGLHLPLGGIRYPQQLVKLLGITLDTNMNFKAHFDRALALGDAALGVTRRLAGRQYGVTGEAARSLYMACVLPIIEYGMEVWHHKLTGRMVKKAQRLQNRAARIILGAAKSTPISVLHTEAALAPIELRWTTAIQRKTLRQIYCLNLRNPVAQLNPAVGTGLRMNRDLLPAGTPRRADKRHDVGHPPWLPQDREHMSKKAHDRDMDNARVTNEHYWWRSATNSTRRKKLQEWYDNYTTTPNGNTSGVPRPACPTYRSLLPEVRLTDRVASSTLAVPLRSAPRSVLSLIVQMRTGHFRGAGSPPTCRCGKLLSTDHIMRQCLLREHARNTLIRTAPKLSVRYLLTNPDGHGALIAYLRAPLQIEMFEE